MLGILSRNAKFIIVAAVMAACTYLGYSSGYQSADTKWKETVHADYIAKQEANRITQEALNDISREHQEELAKGQADAASTVDALERTGVRLRVKLKDTGSQLGECRRESDGKAELHRETSEALIRITQDADKHVSALQKTVMALQGKEVH